MNSSRAIILRTLCLTAISASSACTVASPTSVAVLAPNTETPTTIASPSPTPTRPQTATPTATIPVPTFTPSPAPSVTSTPAPLTTTVPISPTRAPIALAPETYGALPILSAPTDRPAAQHADLNLGLRGYKQNLIALNLVTYSPGVPNAPQLAGLFDNFRSPKFTAAYRVYGWTWECNCKGELIDDWPATLADVALTPGEGIYTPDTGVDIGNDYRAMVLYAEPTRLTLQYTRDDNVTQGYTLHVDHFTVEPNLLTLYQQLNSAGRKSLPAVKAHQRIGRALENYVHIAIRDSGSFMDPRSRPDWWSGR